MGDYLAKIIENKRNKQLVVHLSRKKLRKKLLTAKYLRIKEKDLVS